MPQPDGGGFLAPPKTPSISRALRSATAHGTVAVTRSTRKATSIITRFQEDEARIAIQQLVASQETAEDLVRGARSNKSETVQAAVTAVLKAPDDVETRSIDSLCLEYFTDLRRGLCSQEALSGSTQQLESRPATLRELLVHLKLAYGENVLPTKRKTRWYSYVWHNLLNPLSIALMIAAIISFAFGDLTEGLVVVLLITANCISDTVISLRSNQALEALSELADSPATVVREGVTLTIPSSQLVAGDLVLLSPGGRVPGDIRLTEVRELTIDESLLTGESREIRKIVAGLENETLEVPEVTMKDLAISSQRLHSVSETYDDELGLEQPVRAQTMTSSRRQPSTYTVPDPGEPAIQTFSAGGGAAIHMAYQSTHIISGFGKGIVVNVGARTRVGKIATAIMTEMSKNPSSPLEAGLGRLGGTIGAVALSFVVLVILVGWASGYRDPTKPHESRVLALLSLAVGFAVAAMPESLPTVLTSCFAYGCRNLAKANAIVKKLPAVETLGCTSVICTDKTGTLTQAQLVCERLIGFAGKSQMQTVEARFTQLDGYCPEGDLCIVGSADRMAESLMRLLAYTAVLASPHGTVRVSQEVAVRDVWECEGVSIDAALRVAGAKARVLSIDQKMRDINDHLGVPFSSKRKMQVSVARTCRRPLLGGTFETECEAIAAVKGAPDVLLRHFTQKIALSEPVINISEGALTELTPAEIAEISATNERYAEQALRLIGIVLIPLTEDAYDSLILAEDGDSRLDILTSMRIGAFLGLAAFRDPLKPGIPAAFAECASAGVTLKIITGDQASTSRAIAGAIGMKEPVITNCITTDLFQEADDEICVQEGSAKAKPQLARFGDVDAIRVVDAEGAADGAVCLSDVDRLIGRTELFVRAQPEDKIAIVSSLKKQGHVVAMTGDGVNDAAALQAADIGVAMGITGTDVAKGASDIVLTDDNFVTIVQAIREGRRVYANLQKFVTFLIGTDFGEIIYLVISVVSGLTMPLTGLQTLFVNLVCDTLPAFAIGKEPPEFNVMQKPPRIRSANILNKRRWLYGILAHAATAAAVVLSSTAAYSYLNTGAFRNKTINAQCRTNASGVQYFCQTPNWQPGSGWSTDINYYDERDVAHVLIRAAPGHYDINSEPLTPEAVHLGPFSCASRDPVLGWCIPAHESENIYTVPSRGAAKANAMSFITAGLCETFWAYSVRSWLPLPSVFTRSPVLHIAVAIPATLTILVTCLPGLREMLGLFPVTPLMYAVSIVGALLVNLIDELIWKSWYRHNYGS